MAFDSEAPAAVIAPVKPKAEPEVTRAVMPVFKRRWWQGKKLDHRPVVWSLRERPEEWRIDMSGNQMTQAFHRPSTHSFRLDMGPWVKLYSSNECSCQRFARSFTLIGSFRVWGAAYDLAHRNDPPKPNPVDVHRQFCGHFSGRVSQ